MSRWTRTRAVGTIFFSLLVAFVTSPVPVAGNGPLPPPAAAPLARPADLAPALSPDGTFRGAPGAVGTVDTSAWALVSDLAAGEAPRFAPAARRVAPAAAGPWAGLGSNGAGDGALTDNVWALAASGSDLYAGGTSPTPQASRGPTTSPGGTAAPGPPWARTVPATGRSITSRPSPSRAPTSMWAAASLTPRYPGADYIARWDGVRWSALGSDGAGDGAMTWEVYALAVSGTNVYVGGTSRMPPVPRADYIVHWDGKAWSAMGSNGAGDGALDHDVRRPRRLRHRPLRRRILVQPRRGHRGGRRHRQVERQHLERPGQRLTLDSGAPPSVTPMVASGTDIYVGGNFDKAGGIDGQLDRQVERQRLVRAGPRTATATGRSTTTSGPRGLRQRDLRGRRLHGRRRHPKADRIARWNGSAWSRRWARTARATGRWYTPRSVSRRRGLRHQPLRGRLLHERRRHRTADNIAEWQLGSVREPLPPTDTAPAAVSTGATLPRLGPRPI